MSEKENDYKTGIYTIDNDFICCIILQYMKYPQNRNIRKTSLESDYCLIYTDDKEWNEMKDAEAIQQFLGKYLPVVMAHLVNTNKMIEGKEIERREELNITFIMYIINEVLNQNPLFTSYIYYQARELIYYMTKKYNPELITDNNVS